MDTDHHKIADKQALKVLGFFFLTFSLLVILAVFFTEAKSAKITNLICGSVLLFVAYLFFRGSKKSEP